MVMFGRVKTLVGAVVVAGAAVLGGCGGDSGPDLNQFIGTWNYTSGTQNTQCPSQGINNIDQLAGPPPQTFSIKAGVSTALALTDPSDGCTVNLTVSGSVATIVAGQMCSFTVDGGQATATYTAGMLTVTGTTANVAASATVSVNIGGAVVPCSTTQNGGAVKVAATP